MNDWCTLTDESYIDEGEYFLAQLATRSGQPLHQDHGFIARFAELFMQRYEGKRGSSSVRLPDPSRANPRRTKFHYHRLFREKNGSVVVTDDFVTWASETLGLWIELSRDQSLYAEGGQPHNSEPAYDVLAIATDKQRVPRLRVVQVKATKGRLAAEANKALSNFVRLESGEFDAELSNRLEVIERRRDAPAGVRIADLLFDADRHYRITVVHGQDAGATKILTTFSSRITGNPERRSAYLIPATLPDLWKELGRHIYEQLAD